ncbi:hypothetical protein HPB51_016754 [Rhipicephalus microplus]|uniref:ANKLE2 third alpha/beta domain-containing protein n=1 Tax=Rhipicephalus microplus TaxID=6941 RepID=A0A9J6DAG6_RHIMP|nr:hypothetical protein HPB51_016754 [Rhipicephalus microplus]
MKKVRLADIEKGLERIGRGLAKEMKVPWSEYWSFLDCWCNLASPEGLGKLEAHLRCKRSQVVSERLSQENFPVTSDKLSICCPISKLCEAFGDLKLGREFEKSCGSMQGSQNHFNDVKMPKTLDEKAASASEPGCTLLKRGASYKGVPPIVQCLTGVLFGWAVAHDTGPGAEVELSLQLNEQVLPELAHLERTGGPEQWWLHSWLCREVHILLHDSLNPSERQNLCRALRTQSPPLSSNQAVPASPSSTDDEDDGGSVSDHGSRLYRQPSNRRSTGTLKRHLQCVLRSLCAFLETDSAYAEPCLCFQGTTGSPESDFLRDSHARPVEEEEDADEVFFTPPISPCSSSGSSPEAHTPDEGPPFFIEGSRPSKLDLDVLRALEPSLLEPNFVNPLTYPCVYQWMQVVRSFPKETTSSWLSPMVTHLRRSLRTLSPESPCSSGDGTPNGWRTPQRKSLSTQERPRVLWSSSPGHP